MTLVGGDVRVLVAGCVIRFQEMKDKRQESKRHYPTYLIPTTYTAIETRKGPGAVHRVWPVLGTSKYQCCSVPTIEYFVPKAHV